MWAMGIDPGKSGGVAFINLETNQYHCFKVKDMDITEIALEVKPLDIEMCCLEKVHAMPMNGCMANFKMGYSLASYETMLKLLKIPYELIPPQRWMKRLDCMTGGDKNVTKDKAIKMFPNVKVTHAVADSLLIAKYCELTYC